MKRSKKNGVLLFAVTVLAMGNIVYYLNPSEEATVAVSMSGVRNDVINNKTINTEHGKRDILLKDFRIFRLLSVESTDRQAGRDIFRYSKNSDRENQPEESVHPKEKGIEQTNKANKIHDDPPSSPTDGFPDFRVVAISKIGGIYQVMIDTGGRKQLLNEGDVFEGRFIVSKIEMDHVIVDSIRR